jgi:NADP-dependent 3-hydroxy acid dehydrogenase YdfG
VITGAGRGIGAAIAEAFSANGYSLCLVGRNSSEVQSLADRLALESGKPAHALQCDVSDWDQVAESARVASESLGGVDVLVNNAGGWLGDPLETIDPTELTSLTSSILLGTMYWSKAVLPVMRAGGGGFILNIGSTSGLASSRDSAAASAPKAGVAALSHALAREAATAHVRVGVLHPSRVKKGVPRETAESADEAGAYRAISPPQVADVALWMVSQPPNVTISELVLHPSGEPL